MHHHRILSACCALFLGAGLVAADTAADATSPAPVTVAPAPAATAPVVRPMPIMPERYVVQLADLPEAGQKVLKEEVTGKKTIAFIEKINRAKKDGVTIVTYHVEVAQEDGKLKTVILDGDGKIKNMPMPRMMQGAPGQSGPAPIPMKRPEVIKAEDKTEKIEKTDKPAQ
jgi:hypothetical protein